MYYTIKSDDLVHRDIIRSDQTFEFLNKMSDSEIEIFNSEVKDFCDGDTYQILNEIITFQIIYSLRCKGS